MIKNDCFWSEKIVKHLMKKCNNWLQKNAVGWKVTFPGSMRRAEEWRWVLFPYLWGKWVEKIWTIVKSGIRKKFWVERSLSLVPFFMSLTMRILILLKSIIPQTALSCRGPGGSLRPVEGRTGTVPKLLPHFACVFTVFERSRIAPLQRNAGYPHELRARSQKNNFFLP